MTTNEIILLLTTDDRVIAEDIQRLLEEVGIYTLLISDHPAAFYMSAYFGLNPAEGIGIQINSDDYPQAIEILKKSPYGGMVDNA